MRKYEMQEEVEGDLKQRTKLYALEIIKLCATLPNNEVGWVIGKQLLRSGTSVGANTRAAFRGRSRKEFIAKIGTVIEEADGCSYWLELLVESETIGKNEKIVSIMQETDALTAIFVSMKTRYKE